MTQRERYVTLGIHKADQLAKHGASGDRAEFAESIVKEAREAKQHIQSAIKYAAVFLVKELKNGNTDFFC